MSEKQKRHKEKHIIGKMLLPTLELTVGVVAEGMSLDSHAHLVVG